MERLLEKNRLLKAIRFYLVKRRLRIWSHKYNCFLNFLVNFKCSINRWFTKEPRALSNHYPKKVSIDSVPSPKDQSNLYNSYDFFYFILFSFYLHIHKTMAGSTWNIEEMNHLPVKGYVITEEPKKKNTDQLDENPKMNHLPVTLYT